ncbi:MAG: hypothetical protein AB1779_04860 [Candidatus Thermoplasmatota archaeon]
MVAPLVIGAVVVGATVVGSIVGWQWGEAQKIRAKEIGEGIQKNIVPIAIIICVTTIILVTAWLLIKKVV